MIRVLICGARDYVDRRSITHVVTRLVDKYGAANLLVITGAAPGADTIAARICRDHDIHVAEVEALWDTRGRSAGPQRNRVMLSLKPSIVIAFHHHIDDSKGTAHMLWLAERAGVRTMVVP